MRFIRGSHRCGNLVNSDLFQPPEKSQTAVDGPRGLRTIGTTIVKHQSPNYLSPWPVPYMSPFSTNIRVSIRRAQLLNFVSRDLTHDDVREGREGAGLIVLCKPPDVCRFVPKSVSSTRDAGRISNTLYLYTSGLCIR